MQKSRLTLQWIRRFLSRMLLVGMMVNIFSPVFVFASADLIVESLQVNGVSNSIAINPGDSFKVSLSGKNNGPDSLSSVYGQISFSDNTAFSYLGNLNTYVGFSLTNGPIQSSEYNSSDGLKTQITNATRSAINVNEKPKISSAATSNFTVSATGGVYQYTVFGAFTAVDASSNPVVSTQAQQVIYVNVKPHITDYYFEKADGSTTTTQIQGGQSEAINLVVRVKDFNGCSNIDAGVVSTNLSPLGLSTAEPLTYVSCDVDGKTAVFKKTGITTISSLGDKTFTSGSFSATDEDGNVNMVGDVYFGTNDKTANIVLTVIPPAAPSVLISSVSELFVGGASKQSTSLVFSGSQNGEYKVSVGSDGSCNSGTILQDWTGSGSYVAYSPANIAVLSSSLSVGQNMIYVCMKNSGGTIGSASITVTKDVTAPLLSSFSLAPASVTVGNSSVTYTCSEDGFYQVEVGTGSLGAGIFVGSGASNAGNSISQSISNGLLSNGSNSITTFCLDKAGNISSMSGTITKTPPTPSMSGMLTSFSDMDFDYDGLDGRDMFAVWNSGALVGFEDYFESYRVYLLPSTVSFNANTQTRVALVTQKTANSWSGAQSLTVDSLGAGLVSGASYKICIAIMGTSGLLGSVGCSSDAILTADVVNHPTILSARFTSSTNLELTTDATLDNNLLVHSGALIGYRVSGTSFSGASVHSINGTKINITIPTLASTAAIGTDLLVATGAIRANGGGYNNALAPAFSISDGQAPTIGAFTKNTNAQYGSFYKGNLSVSYSFSEEMSGGGNTRIVISRISGNADGASHVINITDASGLSSGSHTTNINLDSLSLVSGTVYQIQLIGKDVAGNSVSSSVISSIGYDNNGPSTPSLTSTSLFSTLTPVLNWLASIDDSGNGSGVQKYILQVYATNTCSENNIQTYSNVLPSNLSQALTTLPTDQSNYGWSLTAVDNMGNTGATATCSAFRVDTTVPTITNAVITDETISSTSYAKNSDSLRIAANVSHSDSSHIWMNLDALLGGTGHDDVSCANPGSGITCTYSAGVVTYRITAGSMGNGVRQVSLRAQNISGGNEQTAIASITADNTAPAISTSTLTSPNGGETWGGTMRSITWNSTSISDSVGISYIRLEYSVGGGSWNLIGTGSNNGSYQWNIASLQDRTDYQVRISAIDHVGNVSFDVSDAVFAIDKAAPVVSSSALLAPNGNAIYMGGQSLVITWNPLAITDVGGLATNPITLSYSTDSGSTWTQIATNLSNNGSYTWTVPSVNINRGLIQLTVKDLADNINTDLSDSVFIIDSTAPGQVITYAGNGGNTPQNSRRINSSGIDVSASVSDAYLSGIEYQFANTSDSNYWNATASGWTSSGVWNILCADGKALGTDNSCNNLSTTISPTIIDSKNYSLIIRSLDEAGNMTTSITHAYIGDTTAPTLSVNPVGVSYLSGSLMFSGAASDAGSSVSSVKLQIKKGVLYWDGSSWVVSPQSLLASTANSYATWNYTFTPPLADPDGQDYDITVTAYDNAYRINNSASQTRQAIKDVTGPQIDANIFTFSTGAIRSGNASMTITWNPALITTSGASLATNPIKLEYNFTGSVVTIADNLPNTGSYSFTLPVVDTTTAKIIVSASDSLGNLSTSVASSSFVIDSTPPTVMGAETLDQIASGKIDGVLIRFSERVQDVDTSAFSINGGIIPVTSWSWAGVPSNQDTIVLNFSSTGTSADTPTVSYTASGARDIVGHPLASGAVVASDKAVPRISKIEAYDQDSNGKIDQIVASFSENLGATSVSNGWTLGGAMPGVSISSATANGKIIALGLVESASPNTDTTGLELSLTNVIYADLAGNLAGNFTNQQVVDRASPKFSSVITKDTDSNGKIDQIIATSTENLTGAISGFSFGNLATGASYTGSSVMSGGVITFSIQETSLASDTGQIPTITYLPGNLADISGNTLAAISGVSVTDGVVPKIASRTTRDFDGDGKIDAIEVLLTEGVDDSFSGIAVSVAGYVVSGFDTSCNGSTSNDSRFCISLEEASTSDTSSTPAMQIVSNSSLGDAAGNKLMTEASGVVAIDGAGPVVIGARYDTAGAGVDDDVIYLTLSESLSGSTIDAIASTDFILSSGGAFGPNSITSFSSGNTARITLGAGATALTTGVSKIGIATAAISDIHNNTSPIASINNQVVVSPTVIINEVMWSNTGSSVNQYIELHNMGASSVDITGWTIQNIGGNGVHMTLPSATIAANGYYLIVKSSPTSSLLSVSPDLVNASMNLSVGGQNSLALKNGSVTLDMVTANPWPAGNNNLPAAMERKALSGDGLDSTSWYTSVAQTNFDSGSTALGTPGVINVFDVTPPIISATNIADNSLFAIGSGFSQNFDYSDSIGINTASITYTLEKWNGSAYVDVTTSTLASSGVTATQSLFTFNSLSFGKYRSIFSIADTSGNTTQKTTIFFVDKLEMIVSTGSVNIGNIQQHAITYASDVIVTVKTLGAGFTLTLGGSGAMNSGINTLPSWSGAIQEGFGFDYSESGSGANSPFLGTLQGIGPTVLATYASGSIDANGLQKTYIYTLRYGAKNSQIQAAGQYLADTKYIISADY